MSDAEIVVEPKQPEPMVNLLRDLLSTDPTPRASFLAAVKIYQDHTGCTLQVARRFALQLKREMLEFPVPENK